MSWNKTLSEVAEVSKISSLEVKEVFFRLSRMTDSQEIIAGELMTKNIEFIIESAMKLSAQNDKETAAVYYDVALLKAYHEMSQNIVALVTLKQRTKN